MRGPKRLSGEGEVKLSANRSRTCDFSRGDLIVGVASFWHWEETEDSKGEGVKTRGGDNAPDVTKACPMAEGEHGERPPQHDRGGQNRYRL